MEELVYNRDFGNRLMAGFVAGAFVSCLSWGSLLALAASPCG
jgi:hypothetical protein